MQKVVTFNKVGYDPFIDFIKAFAIICVLIGHTFPYLEYFGYGLWVGMQVPLFVLIQVFHSLKKDKTSFDVKKIIWRVFVPFILVQLFVFIIFVLFGNQTIQTILVGMLVGGGYGPGSYFPWVYMQIACFLPILSCLINKSNRFQNALIAIIVCECFEMLFSIIDLPDFIHRLLAVRYFFLIYLGWIWVKEGIVINWKSSILSILSFLSAIYFYYFSINDEPLFYQTGWAIHRWPCYYYVAIWGGYLLWGLFNVMKKNNLTNNFIILLARCSYEIFLIQMVIISLYPLLTIIPCGYLGLFIWIFLVFLFSIWGGFLFNKYYNMFLQKYIIKK